jgi:TldD protein
VTTRRQFLFRSGAVAAAVAATGALPRSLRGATVLGTPIDTAPRAGDPMLRDLAMRALDAAKSAGATYADIRFTLTRTQALRSGSPFEAEHVAVGVRALASGAWGFAASPVWTLEEAARLGRAAALQAKTNVWDNVPPVELGPRPPAAVGSWASPVKRDPFTVPIAEKLDFIDAVEAHMRTFRGGGGSMRCVFERQERTFASTDGAFCTQTLYNSLGSDRYGNHSLILFALRRGRSGALRTAEFVSPTAAGYEVFDDEKLLDVVIPRLYDEALQLRTVERLPPSRYEVVFDGHAMAALVNETLGAALEVDRALGLEANATGTSYLGPVDGILGGKAVGSPLLNVAANRSLPTGAASAKWDDDGVEPDTFPVVQNGAVVDYLTNREHMHALAGWYGSKGKPVRSHGCAASGTATDMSIIHTPNLHMLPTASDTSVDALIAGVADGIAVFGANCFMDHQKLTGQGRGHLIYRIKKGKLAGAVDEQRIAFLFRSPDLWKNLKAVGGAGTVMTHGFATTKGQPAQTTTNSVQAPAAVIRNVAMIDIRVER